MSGASELASQVEDVLRDNGCVDDCGCETWDALRELRSRAEQHDQMRVERDAALDREAGTSDALDDVQQSLKLHQMNALDGGEVSRLIDRCEAAERERDHMRAALEQISRWPAAGKAQERARAVLAGLSQPGNTQP